MKFFNNIKSKFNKSNNENIEINNTAIDERQQENEGIIEKPSKKQAYQQGLHRTKRSLGEKILNAIHLKKNLDNFYDELEEVLVSGDVGIETTLEILKEFKDLIQSEKIKSEDEMKEYFKKVLSNIILEKPFKIKEDVLNVIFVFGVNGVGKTTSIAKLANLFKGEDKKVLIAACDTFRAGAVKQLSKWAYSIDVQIVKHDEGGAPSAVLYDAIDAANSRKIDVLIVDTAGRFHNRENLMQELEKLNKVIDKKLPDCSRHNFLVLDSGTGHNAYVQAQSFHEVVNIDGIILAKLDSTAKGGIVLPISYKLNIPVVFIGIGEKAVDILPFDKNEFITSLF